MNHLPELPFRRMTATLRKAMLFLAVAYALVVPAYGQVGNGNRTRFAVFGAFHGTDLDPVLLSNGNLHIVVPHRYISLTEREVGLSLRVRHALDTGRAMFTNVGCFCPDQKCPGGRDEMWKSAN